MKTSGKTIVINILVALLFLALGLFNTSKINTAQAAAYSSNQLAETATILSDENLPEEEFDEILIIELAVGLLLVASLVGIVTERLRVPYTAGLVLIGLVLALVGEQELNVSPELFLGILVPPLIFEAAFQVKSKDLIRDLAPILSLAIPGVLLTTFLVGGVLYWGTNFSLTTALVFGSLIAATDPVAVVSLFRSLGVPPRLQLLLEGESLFNDGTAIVLFNLMVAIAITGNFNVGDSIIQFFVVSGGGFITGLILGLLISQAISIIDNPLIETTLTSVLAFGSYLLAEQLHVSGVLAVVAAGLISGNLGPQRMAPTTKILVFNFWEYAAFLANSFVFLLIGLQIDLNILVSDWQIILWAIIAVLVARAASIYGLSWIGRGVPRRFKHILYWGGLRGAISLALALSLPVELGDQIPVIRSMAFGVVLFTLLVQGLTMKPFINKMALGHKSEAQEEYEGLNARAIMSRTAYSQLESMYQDGLLSKPVWNMVSKPLENHASNLVDAATRTIQSHPEIEFQEIESAIKEALNSERAILQDLLRQGKISEDTFSKLAQEVDTALTDNQAELIHYLRSESFRNVKDLMAIMLQEKDQSQISGLLESAGYPVTHIASTGGFLGRKNATLLVGIPAGKSSAIRSLLLQATALDFEPESAEGLATAEQRQKGATIFSLKIERYEEL